PRPPTLLADVLTAKNPILIKGQDECSTNLSFRIRFSGEESAFPASRFRDTRRCPVSRDSVRRRIPALIETDSYQGTPSGVPPTTHPCRGATATARSFTLPSHQSPAAHGCHGSVADELSLGGKIPANSNSVFTSRQSPFRARGIARSAFCNSRCWLAEGREEEDTLEAGALGCGSGSVATTQDSFS